MKVTPMVRGGCGLRTSNKRWFSVPAEAPISVADNAGSNPSIAGSVADNSGLNVFQLQIIPVRKWR
jgi:hypothetical protein